MTIHAVGNDKQPGDALGWGGQPLGHLSIALSLVLARPAFFLGLVTLARHGAEPTGSPQQKQAISPATEVGVES